MSPALKVISNSWKWNLRNSLASTNCVQLLLLTENTAMQIPTLKDRRKHQDMEQSSTSHHIIRPTKLNRKRSWRPILLKHGSLPWLTHDTLCNVLLCGCQHHIIWVHSFIAAFITKTCSPIISFTPFTSFGVQTSKANQLSTTRFNNRKKMGTAIT